jgi:hypothetical protein
MYTDSYAEEETEYDEEGNEMKKTRKKTKQKVVSEYPSIDIVNRSDIYFDPRYVRQDDMPALVEVKNGIRLSYFTKNPKKYMDVERLSDVCKTDYDSDPNGYKQRIFATTGIMPNFE